MELRVRGLRMSYGSAEVVAGLDLEIETGEGLQINLDGEPLTGTRFRFEVLPRRLAMKLPGECPLIG